MEEEADSGQSGLRCMHDTAGTSSHKEVREPLSSGSPWGQNLRGRPIRPYWGRGFFGASVA